MVTKEDLEAALKISQEIERRQQYLNEFIETGGVGGASTNDPVSGGIKLSVQDQIVDMQEKIDELVMGFKEEQVIVRRMIDLMVIGDIDRELLINRCVKCFPWKLVGPNIGYTERHARRLYENFWKRCPSMSVDVN